MDLELASDLDGLRREIKTMDERDVCANLLVQHGALHAVRFLLTNGKSLEDARSMEESIEQSIGVLEQAAAERGYSLEIVHHYSPDGATSADPSPAPAVAPVAPWDFETALIRWSVVCRSWQDLAAGHQPEIGPFLAGWFTRCMGASTPADLGQFRDSFRVGWREADTHIEITFREQEVNP
jgi:hypothetical protein